MNNEQEFDQFANDYNAHLSNSIKNMSSYDRDYFCEYKIACVKNQLKTEVKTILDFGCGDGLSAKYLREYFPSAKIVGLDVSCESIKLAQERNLANAEFIAYDGENIPLEENSFDLIFSSCVFHHIEVAKREFSLSYLKNLLSQNGKLFVFEHNPLNPFTQKVVKDCVFDVGVTLISAGSLKKMTDKIGFKNPKINYTLFIPRYKIFKPMFKFEQYLTWCPLGAQYYLSATKN